ncbi:hypothetical protein FRB99_001026 [Tulasnella sp. 403]|nr:hypothetical protein FRB99_001026 [Tulasnella sp. 403]
MPRTRQMFEAASILSAFLSAASIPHAFYGGFTSVALGSPRDTEEMCCVVEGGFKAIRSAIQGSEIMTANQSSWSGRLFVTYHDPIPPLEIEILKAGETGPKRINPSNVMIINQLPFLSISEFIRAKMNDWVLYVNHPPPMTPVDLPFLPSASHGSEADAHDIIFVLCTYTQAVDLNRIQENEMDRFIKLYPGSNAAYAEELSTRPSSPPPSDPSAMGLSLNTHLPNPPQVPPLVAFWSMSFRSPASPTKNHVTPPNNPH